MSAQRHDPATRRRRLDVRVYSLKRRFGVASLLGFGALFGLVTQHAVGSQKHLANATRQATATSRVAATYFDANGPSYAFDDSGIRASEQSGAASPSQPVQQQPAPVAQSSGS